MELRSTIERVTPSAVRHDSIATIADDDDDNDDDDSNGDGDDDDDDDDDDGT